MDEMSFVTASSENQLWVGASARLFSFSGFGWIVLSGELSGSRMKSECWAQTWLLHMAQV